MKRNIFCFLLLALLTVAIFSELYNRENSLSYSIGYNLYGAERVLDGEIPYRDFHTLYPPAIVYLNAAIFKLFGITLLNALFTVMLFKVGTTLVIYLCARRMLPISWSLVVAAFSLIWLRPNGPFKAVPMHYGALFLALALFFLLSKRLNGSLILSAGIALGVLTLFKHNIGAYAVLATLASFLVDETSKKFSIRYFFTSLKPITWLLIGVALPVLPTLFFIWSKGALRQMIAALLFGPGEFLLNRLAAAPMPFIPLGFAVLLGIFLLMMNKVKAQPVISTAISLIAVLLIAGCSLVGKQSWVDALIFYLPVFTIIAGLLFVVYASRFEFANQRAGLLVTLFTAAALMEAFPRFAREQAIAAMPFVALLLLFLLFNFRPLIEKFIGANLNLKMTLAILPLLLFVMGARLFAQTFFDRALRFKSTTELAIARGRGVYFPAEKAAEIDQVTSYLRERVPEGGYFFAESYAGSSFLFLADRNNPSGAQFWGGVGVKERERIETLEALKREDVQVIVTNSRDLEAEKYPPMREFINQNFKLTRQFGDVQILEKH
ncbi:MAG: hypothetical protein AB1757_10165 [Acidobacteriota bacterium]